MNVGGWASFFLPLRSTCRPLTAFASCVHGAIGNLANNCRFNLCARKEAPPSESRMKSAKLNFPAGSSGYYMCTYKSVRAALVPSAQTPIDICAVVLTAIVVGVAVKLPILPSSRCSSPSLLFFTYSRFAINKTCTVFVEYERRQPPNN